MCSTLVVSAEKLRFAFGCLIRKNTDYGHYEEGPLSYCIASEWLLLLSYVAGSPPYFVACSGVHGACWALPHPNGLHQGGESAQFAIEDHPRVCSSYIIAPSWRHEPDVMHITVKE